MDGAIIMLVYMYKYAVVCNYYSLKLQGKQCKQNSLPKSYKTEIKILSKPRLA